MPVIPFSHSWPYEKQYQDIYLHECPFCGEDQVLTHMKMKELEEAKEGIKKQLNLPCCHGRLVILEADEDYLWTNQVLREDRSS
ncbi:hypothetical protein [Alkalicoccobacillus gibsonii]|jgi:phage terminase large subunit GpA-like protein|uniref:Uncharacterized protein n=1 Tax=Alkalicoccobacillus gibsonii TaxID=79881 RepID=A0ABU9VN15_9BACI|nr:hypothetical protein [Alkalicoccobacillus gibsonii]MBM0066250.1 hypothetical protein [Alkalicoccobacillus gibsonii]